MKTTIRAAFAALALVPALLLAPAAGAQDADCYPVPPEGCDSSTDGGDTDGGTTDGTDGGTDTDVEATTSGNTDDGDTDGDATDGDATDGEQPTEVLPTIIDRPAEPGPQPAPEPAVEAAELPRTGTDAGDWAALAALAIAGGAGAIALTRRETDAVEIES